MSTLKELMARQKILYDQKNTDYGNSFHTTVERLSLVAALVRITDKMERIRRLQEHDAQVKDESLRDTISDALNYLLMFSAEIVLCLGELAEEGKVPGQPDNVTLVHQLMDNLAEDELLPETASLPGMQEIWEDLCAATMEALTLHSEEKLDEVLTVNHCLAGMMLRFLAELTG